METYIRMPHATRSAGKLPHQRRTQVSGLHTQSKQRSIRLLSRQPAIPDSARILQSYFRVWSPLVQFQRISDEGRPKLKSRRSDAVVVTEHRNQPDGSPVQRAGEDALSSFDLFRPVILDH